MQHVLQCDKAGVLRWLEAAGLLKPPNGTQPPPRRPPAPTPAHPTPKQSKTARPRRQSRMGSYHFRGDWPPRTMLEIIQFFLVSNGAVPIPSRCPERGITAASGTPVPITIMETWQAISPSAAPTPT